jgi:3D (Asp-Asp-Asp) domain-containing protein
LRRLRNLRGAPLAYLGAALLVLSCPVSGSADSASHLRQRAGELRTRNAALSDQSRSAVVDLYALDSRLSAARARVESLRSQLAATVEEQAAARRRLGVVRHVLAISQRQLGRHLVALYEQGEPDSLAIMLGSDSLSDAVTSLETARSVVTQGRVILAQAQKGRASLQALTHFLASRQTRLQGLESDAAAAAGALDAARSDRIRFIAQLASERSLNEQQISSLESQAQAAEARAREVAAQRALAPPPAPAPAPAPATTAAAPVGGRALTVVATAYTGAGGTATGVPTGPGIVAVDPNVIPFGTHMTIPGYGEGVAADTGSAIQGARIDVWVPTEAQAEQWGVRTVTIYLR